MTSVNVSNVANTITVTEGGSTTVVNSSQTSTVTAITEGPQGPQGTPGPGGLVVNDTAKVDKSVVYYDASSTSFRADAVWTIPNLSDGGNF